MNTVTLLGNLTKDIELKQTSTGKSYARFDIAVRRNFVVQGQPNTDFFNCVAWSPKAEFIAGHFGKGDRICINGEIQNRQWKDNKGETHYATDIVVEKVDFAGNKDKTSNNNQAAAIPDNVPDGFVVDESEDDLPF